MRNYVVIVRDFCSWQHQPSDEYLFVMDRIYVSPVVSIDLENGIDKALDTFDEKYRKYFSHFLHLNYELVEV